MPDREGKEQGPPSCDTPPINVECTLDVRILFVQTTIQWIQYVHTVLHYIHSFSDHPLLFIYVQHRHISAIHDSIRIFSTGSSESTSSLQSYVYKHCRTAFLQLYFQKRSFVPLRWPFFDFLCCTWISAPFRALGLCNWAILVTI